MRIKFWIGLALSVGLLIFLLSRIDMAMLWESVKAADPLYLALMSVLIIFFYWIRAVRWRYLTEPVKKGLPVRSLFSATMIGFMANNVLPARLGEFVRAYALGKRERLPASPVFATIVVERLFDGMSVLLLILVAIAFMPPEVAGGVAGTFREVGIVSLGLYVVMIAVIAFFMRRPHLPERWARALVRPFSAGLSDKAGGLARSFMDGLEVVKEPRLLVMILLFTVVHWGLLPLTPLIMFKAFGFHYGAYDSLFIFVLTCIGVALPSTPGYVGTFHAAVMGGMVLLGLDNDRALGFAIVTHAVNYIPVTLLGLYYLSKENMSLGGIKKLEEGVKT
jgi:glycosyltransferase 2 family protein